MPAERLVSRLEEIVDRLPKEGLAASKVVGLVSRLAQLASTVDTVISKAKCVAEARGGKKEARGVSLYATGCAGIHASEEDGVLRLWKVGSHAFAARLAGLEASVEDELVGITVTPEEVRVRIVSGDGKTEETVKLSDVATIYSGYQMISYVLKKLESHLRAAERDLAACERASAIQC